MTRRSTSSCYRTAPAVEPLRRYTNNVYHQAEVVYAMLHAALVEGAPDKVFWRMPLLPWSRGMTMCSTVGTLARPKREGTGRHDGVQRSG